MSNDPRLTNAHDSPREPAAEAALAGDGVPQQIGAEAVEEVAAEALMARAVNFCSRCGARYTAESIDCLACLARQQNPFAPFTSVTDGESRHRALSMHADETASVRSAIWLYFTMLAVSIVLIAVTLASRDREAGLIGEWVAGGAMSIVAMIWVIRWRETVGPLLRTAGRPGWYLFAPLLGSATFIVASLVVSALTRWSGAPRLGYLKDYNAAGYSLELAILWICVQPAIFEELAFRGVIVSALDRVLTRSETAIVSALLFGILHLSIPSLAHLTLLGLLLAWLRRRSRSLYPCMIMHFTHNLLVLLDERYRWLPW